MTCASLSHNIFVQTLKFVVQAQINILIFFWCANDENMKIASKENVSYKSLVWDEFLIVQDVIHDKLRYEISKYLLSVWLPDTI